MNDEHAPLRGFLDRAHERHPAEPRRIAAALRARAAALPCDGEGAEAVRLAEHVMLGHLADAEGLAAFAAALPETLRTGEAGRRIAWALASLAGSDMPALADAPRWRALQNVVLALAARGDVERAARLLRQDEAAAAAHDDADARRAYAACANNVALELRLGPRGDAARDALMLEAAALARRAWERAGTWLHVERAEYQLALCHAVLGHGAQALLHSRACLEGCEANVAEPAERFFAHEAMVHALRAAGESAAATAQRQCMQQLLEEVGEPSMRDWCAQTLRALPE